MPSSMSMNRDRAGHKKSNQTYTPPPICTLSPNLPLPPLSFPRPPLRPAAGRPPMRIRRQPPGQPLAYLLPTDPYPAPPPAPASRDHPPTPPGDKQEGELHLHPATNDSSAADLGDAARSSSSSPLRRPALPPQVPRSLLLPDSSSSSSSRWIPIRVLKHSWNFLGHRRLVSYSFVSGKKKERKLPSFRCTCTQTRAVGSATDLANPHVPGLLLSQDGAVERERSRGLHLLGAGAQQEQQASRYVMNKNELLLPEMKP